MGQAPDEIELEYATAMGNRAMALMATHGVAPTPANFEVWFDYARGASTYLKKTIDILIGNKRTFDAAVSRDLYLTYARSRSFHQSAAQELSGQIQSLIQNARELLDAAATDNQTQARNVDAMSSELASTSNAKAVIERLVSELSKAAVRASSLETSFAQTSEEMDRIRDSLQAAEKQSSVDPLTELANRRALDDYLRKAQMAAMEHGSPLSILLVDIDHFKSFNDTFGHQTGDQVLRLVAKVLRDQMRQGDLAARYGGEELMAALPGADLGICHVVAERIRLSIAECRMTRRSTGETIPGITVSIGVAQFRPGESIDAMIERCDQALYAAKHGGRNRTVSESDLEDSFAATAAE